MLWVTGADSRTGLGFNCKFMYSTNTRMRQTLGGSDEDRQVTDRGVEGGWWGTVPRGRVNGGNC